MTTSFPEPLRARPAKSTDLAAVAWLVAAAEKHDLGEAFITIDDIKTGWNRSEFDVSDDVLLVFNGDELVAWGEVCNARADATVAPSWRQRGVGAALLAWTEQRAAEQGGDGARVGQTVADDIEAAAALFLGKGYSIGHTSWVLALPEDVEVAMPRLAAGVKVRPFRSDSEERAVYQVVEDAFNEWPGRRPQRFDQWQAWVTARPDFDPSLLLVAADGDEVIGTGFGIDYPDEGWVHQLAVRADRRGKGLGKALLSALFTTFRDKGYTNIGVSTDSRTGALNLYTGLGMVVTRTFTHYFKEL